MKLSRYGQIVGATLAGALALSACGSDNPTGGSDTPVPAAGSIDCADGTLAGAGASSQENAMAAWVAGYTGACEGATVNYDSVGSGAGRSQFIESAVAFAGSDSIMDEEETAQATERCNSEVVHLPGYISPIAVIFNLDGVDSLNMKPEVIAGVFDQKITKWNDEAIAEDNPDVDLPDTDIVPVNRSDESGTTENFVKYLAASAPGAWSHEVSGDWPIDPVEAAQGSSGVVSAVQGGTGTIGYVDASHAADFGTVAVGVGDEFVAYSPEAAAAIVDSAPLREGNTENDLAVTLDYATEEAGVYPIVLVSYEIVCMEYADQADADLVKSFIGYITGEEGQAASAAETGSAPLSADTRDKIQATLDKIQATS